MLKSSLSLIRDHFAIIASGFLLIFFSIFGQTVFIGVFLPDIREELGLSQSLTGTIYGAATFLSAIIVIYTGKKFDDVPMLKFLSLTFIGLAIGCFLFANATGPVMLFIAFLLLRQFGQGLMVFAASTSINRYLDEGRGRAMAITSFAAPIHTAIFPLMALTLMEYAAWQTLWMGFAAFVLIILWPLFALLLKDHERTTHTQWQNKVFEEERQAALYGDNPGHFTRKDALGDWKIYALIATLIVPPCFTTALFFFQAEIAFAKDISQLEFAGSLGLFTIFSILASVVSGILIDKFGEAPSLGIQPILYFIGMAVIILAGNPWMLSLGLGFIGASEGFARTTGGPVLARLYGTKHLGAIKAMVFSTLIVASALSPVLVGVLLDLDFHIMDIFVAFNIYIALATCLLIPVLRYLWRLHHSTHTASETSS